jgi:hypothetical protein
VVHVFRCGVHTNKYTHTTIAGLPTNIPAHTVVLACISSNVGICSAAEKILTVSQSLCSCARICFL